MITKNTDLSLRGPSPACVKPRINTDHTDEFHEEWNTQETERCIEGTDENQVIESKQRARPSSITAKVPPPHARTRGVLTVSSHYLASPIHRIMSTECSVCLSVPCVLHSSFIHTARVNPWLRCVPSPDSADQSISSRAAHSAHTYDHSTPPMSRRLLIVVLALALVTISVAFVRALPHSELSSVTLSPAGAVIIPGTERVKDQRGNDLPVAELSGLTWLGDDQWLAVSDKRNLLVLLRIAIDADTPKIAAVNVLAGYTLAGPVRDNEGITYAGKERNSVFISEEETPAVREWSLKDFKESPGSPLPLPKVFGNKNTRLNRGFEALTGKPDHSELWTANEDALVNDGPSASRKAPSIVRLLRYKLADGKATAMEQLAYPVDPVHADQDGSRSPDSGLTDLAELDDGTLLALERSCIWNKNPLAEQMKSLRDLPSMENRIYLIDRAGATDISAIDSLKGAKYEPVKKKLLWSATNTLDNTEGMALGPATAHGRILLVVCDNQEGETKGVLGTRILAFELRTSKPGAIKPGTAQSAP